MRPSFIVWWWFHNTDTSCAPVFDPKKACVFRREMECCMQCISLEKGMVAACRLKSIQDKGAERNGPLFFYGIERSKFTSATCTLCKGFRLKTAFLFSQCKICVKRYWWLFKNVSCEFFKLAETHASNRKLLRAALYKNIRLKGISKEFNFTTKYHERRSCNKVVTTHQELHLGLLCYWVMYWKHLSFIAYLHFFVYFRWRSWLDRYQIDS